jgi:serine/threonine protein kinase
MRKPKASRDAATVAKQVLQLGLVNEPQLREGLMALEQRSPDPEPLLRALERKGYLTPWQSQKLLKGETDGYFLGGYRLLYRIASGSFGRVFRADDPQTGTMVAIKVLRRRWSDRRRTIDLFEREGRVGLSLRHPNIVSVLAVNLDPATGQYYIVMEFVEGGNLRDFMAIRRKLEPAEAVRLLEDAAAGLAYAYSVGVTHRDIKPTNILISSQGAAKLVDFGLAEIYSESNEHDDPDVYRTVDYAGLEKATGVAPGDVRSDIYFLGCVFYEMLTGHSALILTPDRRARMQKERFVNAPRLDPDEFKASPVVFHLVETMMALNPQHRYQTPSQLLEAVRAARRELEGGGPDPADAKPPERTVFVVEKNARLQDALRTNFKKAGFRVFLASDSTAALNRYRQQPFDALVLDAGSAGVECLMAFDQIFAEAARRKRPFATILILSEDQANWGKMVPNVPTVVSMVRPLKLGQVIEKLWELVPRR